MISARTLLVFVPHDISGAVLSHSSPKYIYLRPVRLWCRYLGGLWSYFGANAALLRRSHRHMMEKGKKVSEFIKSSCLSRNGPQALSRDATEASAMPRIRLHDVRPSAYGGKLNKHERGQIKMREMGCEGLSLSGKSFAFHLDRRVEW